jgi:hypothetical protein
MANKAKIHNLMAKREHRTVYRFVKLKALGLGKLGCTSLSILIPSW